MSQSTLEGIEPMMEEQVKRRRYPRIPSENAVLVKMLGSEVSEGFAKTFSVGLGGCMFLNTESIGVGAYLDLLISVRGTVAKAMAKVVYELPDDNGYQVGVEFIQISDADRRLLEILWTPDQIQDSEAE